MQHLQHLAITTILLAMASQPALAQADTQWVGGETGLAVNNTPSTADRAQVKADLAKARSQSGWDQRLSDSHYPAETGVADASRSRDTVKQEVATALRAGDDLNPRPQ